jgi:DNA-binding PadR family transcriptional regulator
MKDQTPKETPVREDANRFLPLTPATLHILLALAGGDMHGYAIMQDVLRQSEGRYKLGPGTLYDNLQKLVKQGMVKELGAKAGDEDSRRRYYRLTSLGSGVLSAEISRLEGVVRDAKLQLSPGRPRRT